MSESSRPREEPKTGQRPRDAGSWARGRNVLRVSDVSAGAVNLNVEGRRVIGALQGMPVYTGVMVLYSDDVSFTVMTAEGLPEAGWNTISAHEGEDGSTVIQIQSLARASDPIYEVGFRLFGSTEQERIWTHVLSTLAVRFGVRERVYLEKALVDPKLQWYRVGNIWHNAGLRSVVYAAANQIRKASGLFHRRSRG